MGMMGMMEMIGMIEMVVMLDNCAAWFVWIQAAIVRLSLYAEPFIDPLVSGRHQQRWQCIVIISMVLVYFVPTKHTTLIYDMNGGGVSFRGRGVIEVGK